MMLIKKEILLGLFLMILGGCGFYYTIDCPNCDELRQKILCRKKDMFTDPGEKEAFLKGKWIRGMTVDEVKLSLHPSYADMDLHLLQLKYVLPDGRARYEATLDTNSWLMARNVNVIFWFKDGKLYEWEHYPYEGVIH